MSAFEVALTPPHIRNAQKKAASREPTIVVLALFSAKSIVTFEDIPVTKTARRVLNIHNPTDDILKVLVTKTINPMANAELEWTSNEIPSQSFITLEIVWSPTAIWSTREVIQFTDNRNFKKDVPVILKSVDKTQNPKATLRKAVHGADNRVITKKLTLKSPKMQRNRLTVWNSSMVTNVNNAKERRSVKPDMSRVLAPAMPSNTVPDSNVTFDNIPTVAEFTADKENVSPPNDICGVMDSMAFTPVSKSRNDTTLDYLASLPTPSSNVKSTPMEYPRHQTQLSAKQFANRLDDIDLVISTPYTIQNRTTVIEHMQAHIDANTSHYALQRTPSINAEHTFDVSSLHTSGFEAAHGTNESLQSHKYNLDVNQHNPHHHIHHSPRMQTISENSELSVNRTQTISSPMGGTQLFAIAEEHSKAELSETYVKPSAHHLTFNLEESTAAVDANLVRDVRLVGTPLKKKFQSLKELNDSRSNLSIEQMILKNNQGSMPNLHKMETVKSIENNRYFYHSKEKDLQQAAATTTSNAQHEADDDMENLGDTSICSIKSTISLHSVGFQEHEILAQSSVFNLNEIGCGKSHATATDIGGGFGKRSKHVPHNTTAELNVSKHLSISSPTIGRAMGPPKSMQSTRDLSQSSRKQATSAYNLNTSSSSLNKRSNGERLNNKHSPTKRVCTDTNSPRLVKGQAIRTKTWGGKLPKKFRMPSVPNRLQLKRPEEERVILFDPELHLRGVINPDPFAATTTLDPFLSATMYLDERAVDKHEVQFKKWLNAMVTIPGDLDGAESKPLDVGKLFNEVQNKDCALAPTKEAVSANYLTKYRLQSLRTAAITLFTSELMRESLSKMLVHVEKKAILIRQDRNLHLDVVLQRSILELLLNFNPLWLRIGLEMVFGETIPMHNNHDIVSLSVFILNRLFRDRYLEAKHPRVYAQGEEYAECIKKHTLKKFLSLLYFLDVAKTKKIIKHNPCLFMKSSEFKETKDILLKFSSSLLGNIGDIQRDLKRIGIVLTHKQTFIDEFDYAFRNLAVDLRDGVRLTKVMEIILLRDDLSRKLRVPAISRTQKIYNVGVALKALEEAEFNLTGSITAIDIADGHREKTLSLLWQIIYRFRAPKFHEAAGVIQKWWRHNWLNVCIRRRINDKIKRQQNNAAIVIQSAYRGHLGRIYAKQYFEERSTAALTIQRYVRRFIAIKEFLWRYNSIIFIQRWYRNQRMTQYVREHFLRVRTSCCVIQRRYRTILLARKIERLIPIAVQVQEEKQVTFRMAVRIQRKFRAFLEMRIVRAEFIRLKRATVIVQQQFRAQIAMQHQRQHFQMQKQMCVRIQQFYRASKQMKTQRTAFLKTKAAAISIQNWYRACQQRNEERSKYVQLKSATILIQKRWQATVKMRRERANYLHAHNAIRTIQICVRANRAMRLQKMRFVAMRNATTAIQQRLRATIQMRHTRNEYQRLKRNVQTIQRRFRANQLAKKYKDEYKLVLDAVRTIQTRYRACLEMRKQRQAYETTVSRIIFMQRRVRSIQMGRKQRAAYVKYRTAVVLVQQKFRAIQCARVQRSKYEQYRSAARTIQIRWRAQLMMRQKRQEFERLKQAAVTFQTRFRAKIAMQNAIEKYFVLREYTIAIQRRVRATQWMKIERNSFMILRQSCITVQRLYRAKLAMRQQKHAFELLKKSAIAIQRRFRARRLTVNAQSEYQCMKIAVISVQRRFRAQQAMKIARAQYVQLRNSTICIQQHFRATMLTRQQCHEYGELKRAIITIQQRFRAKRSMKSTRIEYGIKRMAVISIQRQWRATIQMRAERAEFLRLKLAATLIQRRYRATRLARKIQNEYLHKQTSAIYIQRRYRELIATRHQRVQYLMKRRAISKIQCFVLGFLAMKRARSRYEAMKSAAITIQTRFRAQQQMICARNEYTKQVLATRAIQTYYRAYVQMKHEREQYNHKRAAIICIQIHTRATFEMRRQRQTFVQLQQSVICIQRRYRAILLARKIQNQFKLLRCLVIYMQRKFRANIQMRIQRKSYQQLKAATCLLQTRFRSKQLAQYEHKRFIQLKRVAVSMQAQIRGYLARKRFQALMTPELVAKRRQHKAAKVIQSYYRGHRIRKTRSAALRKICEKTKVLQKNVCPKNTVRHRIQGIIRYLKDRFNVRDALNILKELEEISLSIPHTLIVDSLFIASFCYGIMSQAIRSEIDKQIISLCCRVLLNLARYKPTQQSALQIRHFETVAQILLRWCDKDCDIFNVLCTLLYVLSQHEDMNTQIRDFMITREAIFMLRETKKMVARKERMRAINPPSWMPVMTPKEKRQLPRLDTNFGIRSKTKNYMFNCSVFGFETILRQMNISIN